MSDIAKTIKLLQGTNSPKEKVEILVEHENPLLKEIFVQTYNHFITFGISNIDRSDLEYQTFPSLSYFAEMFDILKKLEKRELTGNAARDAIREHMRKGTEDYADIFEGILKSDLRIGAGVRLINKAYPDLLPEAFCMSANKYNPKKVTYPVWADTKLDGVRCVAVVGTDGVTLFSRNGKVFNNYKVIEEEIGRLGLMPGTKLDGEITMGHFQDLMKTMGKKDGEDAAKDAIYNVFDFIDTEKNLGDRFTEHMTKLEFLIENSGATHVKTVDGNWFDDEESLVYFYEEKLAEGFEGIMIKTGDGMYEFKRGWGWQKMKPEHSEDIEIIGFEEGRGKYEGQLGAFICKLDNGGEVRVGSGLKDEERAELWEKRDEYLHTLIEVKFQEKTKDGSLRFPIFIRFRPDKS